MTQSRDKDGGWAWVVLGACSACVLVTSGLAMLAGMFQKMFLDHFSGDVVLISWITAMFASIMQLAGPVTGVVSTVFGCRASVMAGAILLTAGLFSSSFCNDTTSLLLSFGVTSGLGLGLMYSAAIVRVNLSFVRYRPLASGTVMASGGVGVMVGPTLCGHLLEVMGWAQTLVVLSALSAQLIVAGALLYPAPALARRSPGLARCCARFHQCLRTQRTAAATGGLTGHRKPPADRPQQHQLTSTCESSFLTTESDLTRRRRPQPTSPEDPQTENCVPAYREASDSSCHPRTEAPVCFLPKECETAAEGDNKNSEDSLQGRTRSRAGKTGQEFLVTEEEEEEEGEKGTDSDEKTASLSRNLQRRRSRDDKDGAAFSSGSARDAEETSAAFSDSVESSVRSKAVEMAAPPPPPPPRSLRRSGTDASKSAQSVRSGTEAAASSADSSEGRDHRSSDENNPPPPLTHELAISFNDSAPSKTTTCSTTSLTAAAAGGATTATTTTRQKLRTVLRSPSLLLICAQLFLANAAVGIVLVHFVELCLQAGTDFATVSLAFSVNGLTLTVSRFLLGVLSQDRHVDPLTVYVGLALLSSVVLATMPIVAVTGPLQIVMIGSLGIYSGGAYAMLTEITIHCTGLDTLGLAFGLEMTLAGLGFLVASPIAGWLVVLTKSYDNAIFLAGFLNFVGAFVAMAISVTRPVWKPGETLDVEKDYAFTADENDREGASRQKVAKPDYLTIEAFGHAVSNGPCDVEKEHVIAADDNEAT